MNEQNIITISTHLFSKEFKPTRIMPLRDDLSQKIKDLITQSRHFYYLRRHDETIDDYKKKREIISALKFFIYNTTYCRNELLDAIDRIRDSIGREMNNRLLYKLVVTLFETGATPTYKHYWSIDLLRIAIDEYDAQPSSQEFNKLCNSLCEVIYAHNGHEILNDRFARIVYLVEKGADINSLSEKGNFPIFEPIYHFLTNKEHSLRFFNLITSHPDFSPNLQDSHGNTPLHYVSSCLKNTYSIQKQEQILRLKEILINLDADITLQNNMGFSAA